MSMNENNMITISVEEYKELLKTQARVEAFKAFVLQEKYNIDRKECGIFLGFEVAGDDD